MYSIKLMGLLAGTLLLFTTSCKKDSASVTPQQDLSTPDGLTAALTVKNATLKKGTPPAPSNSAAAPKISIVGSQEIVSAAGLSFVLKASVNQGDAKGVYIAVNGAQSYFDVPTIRNRSGRMKAFGIKPTPSLPLRLSAARTTNEREVAIGVKIPATIQPGTFCITYCVYDASGLISNVVTQCVEIKAFGGNPALAGNWSMEKVVEEDITYYPSVESCDPTNLFYCNGKESTYESCTKINKFDMTFGANGAFGYMANTTYTQPDYETICEKITLSTETESEEYEGAWHYDAATNKLFLIINYADNEAEEDYDSVSFTVTQLNSSTLQFGDESIQYVFKRK